MFELPSLKKRPPVMVQVTAAELLCADGGSHFIRRSHGSTQNAMSLRYAALCAHAGPLPKSRLSLASDAEIFVTNAFIYTG